MNDDENYPNAEAGHDVSFTTRGGARAHAIAFKLGPLWSVVGIVVAVLIGAMTISATLTPYIVLLGVLALLPPWTYVRVDATGWLAVEGWSLVPIKRQRQVLSCPIGTTYVKSSVHAEAGVHAQIGDIWLPLQPKTAVWLEKRRAVIAQEVPDGPYR